MSDRSEGNGDELKSSSIDPEQVIEAAIEEIANDHAKVICEKETMILTSKILLLFLSRKKSYFEHLKLIGFIKPKMEKKMMKERFIN